MLSLVKRLGTEKLINSKSPFSNYFALYLTLSAVVSHQRSFTSADTTLNSKESSECTSSEYCENTKMAEELLHVDFEVFGTVQGVFFRKYTQDQGNKLGLRGYCRNTSSGTVSGQLEGPRPAIDKMKHWLQYTGSPSSRISSANFMNEKVIDSYTLPPGFDIKRTI